MSCDRDECAATCPEEQCADGCADLLPLRSDDGRSHKRFEDTTEWKWTKATCAGLFCVLGRYYDELWFPTALHEWCMLYYQCNHADHYWQRRDAWLAGDEQVRVAVWSEVLRQRARRDRQMRDDADESRTTDPARILELRKLVDEGNERIVMARMDACDLVYDEKEEPTAEERARAETEAAELALADPSEDPNWVEMRRRMRGSLAGLNLARCDVSSELLNHMMIELCNYWRNLPCIEHQIEPLLERNILREIRNFRYRLFGKPASTAEPETSGSCPCPAPEPDACCEPQPDACCNEPARPPSPAKTKRPKSRACSRGPATNKLAEARAKQNAARIRAHEERAARGI